MKYPEIKKIRKELEFLSTIRDGPMRYSVRNQCARRALKLPAELETKLTNNPPDLNKEQPRDR